MIIHQKLTRISNFSMFSFSAEHSIASEMLPNSQTYLLLGGCIPPTGPPFIADDEEGVDAEASGGVATGADILACIM